MIPAPRHRLVVTPFLALCLALGGGGGGLRSAHAEEDGAIAAARSHYEMGLQLFDAREHEQALIEFERANELKSRPAALFMMAQCQYLLGRLKEARKNYQRYADQNPNGEFASLARDRISAIDRRPSTFVINAVPDDVTVRISPDGETGNIVAVGQAPNSFSIPRGRYRVDVTKLNYQGQTRMVEVDVAETKPLFFKLEPIPARLEIETWPRGATLYVNGNRARNPYRQDITPGPVEIFAEASNYEPRSIDLTLAPGEHELLLGDDRFQLAYRQRSGRPELLAASAAIGGLFGAGAVVAAIGSSFQGPKVSSVLLVTGGAISGGIVGWLIATPIVPDYIPDNRALFILGGMWIGVAEGASVGLVGEQIVTSRGQRQDPCPGPGPCRGSLGNQLQAGFYGSVPGLALGLTGGVLLRNHAPTYGRVALIQSAALGGAFLGALTQLALQWKPYGAGWEYTVRPVGENPAAAEGGVSGPGGIKCVAGDATCAFQGRSFLDLMPGALIGLNVGLAAGLLGAYLPDQSHYGPTWKRVLLVDLAVVAGGVAGATVGCVADPACLNQSSDATDRAIVAGSAIAGGALGFVGGWLLSRSVDTDAPSSAPSTATGTLPLATFVPMRDASGATIPAVAAMGSF